MNNTMNTTVIAPNFYITEHFRFTDFICPCCDMLKLVPAVFRHAALLERLRTETGVPFAVTSGYRCPKHNREVGGAPRSWHLLFATDIAPFSYDDDELRRLLRAARDIGFTGIGRYERHLHLDTRPEPATWGA